MGIRDFHCLNGVPLVNNSPRYHLFLALEVLFGGIRCLTGALPQLLSGDDMQLRATQVRMTTPIPRKSLPPLLQISTRLRLLDSVLSF